MGRTHSRHRIVRTTLQRALNYEAPDTVDRVDSARFPHEQVGGKPLTRFFTLTLEGSFRGAIPLIPLDLFFDRIAELLSPFSHP